MRIVDGVFQQRRQENVREKTGDVVRTAFAVHTYHPVFEALAPPLAALSARVKTSFDPRGVLNPGRIHAGL